MSLTRRALVAGAAGLAGLHVLPTARAEASHTHNHQDIIAAFLEADEPGPEWPDEVRLLWMLVRCTPDELDFFDAFVDAAVARCPEELPGAEGARFLIAMARPEPT